MAKSSVNRVYLDTNVLINDYLFRAKKSKKADAVDAHNCLIFLRKPENGFQLYTSTLSIAQLVSTLSKLKIGNTAITAEIATILSKYNVVNFVKENVTTAIATTAKDVEDSFQYSLLCGHN